MDDNEKEYKARELLFKKYKRRISRLVFSSIFLTIISVIIVSVQIFYPYHVVVGLSIYVLSFIPLGKRIYISRNKIKKYKYYEFANKFFKHEKKKVVLLLVVTVFVISFFTLRPLGRSPFKSLSEEQIIQMVDDGLYKSITSMDYLQTSGTELLDVMRREEEDTNNTIVAEVAFNNFLKSVLLSESLTDTYRHFDKIPHRLKDARAKSFIISYSLYIKKYEILHRLMSIVSGNEYKKKILNQYIGLLDKDNVYSEMVNRFYKPKTRLRINAGRIYLMLSNGKNKSDMYGSSYRLLYVRAEEGYNYLLKNFDNTLLNSGEVLVDGIKERMFDIWFPVQKAIANTMGNIIISDRGKDYFIKTDQIHQMQKKMLPGDIMLQRRNWYLSNVGIPGFWTHSAMYTGTFAEMEKYFESEFPIGQYDSFTEYLQSNFPDAYKKYQTFDEVGAEYSVIEAIAPGVVLRSLDVSAHADFVVTLRPVLSKRDKFFSLMRAFSNLGKPYDYNFDFDTRDAIVCSELIFDSYFGYPGEKRGLSFEISMVNGRKIVSPLDIAKKFKAGYGRMDKELEFVYFLRGSEEVKNATVSTEEVFLESVDWPKFSFLQ